MSGKVPEHISNIKPIVSFQCSPYPLSVCPNEKL